jgi:hypothetical protein
VDVRALINRVAAAALAAASTPPHASSSSSPLRTRARRSSRCPPTNCSTPENRLKPAPFAPSPRRRR